MRYRKETLAFIFLFLIFTILREAGIFPQGLPSSKKSDVTEPTPTSSVLSVSTAISPSRNTVSQTAIVTKVVDGDTIEVSTQGAKMKVRLIGVDTPETVDPRKDVQCFGNEASNKAKELLLNKEVRLDIDNTQGNEDKYKRLLRYVYVQDTFINKLLITEGYAHEYTYDDPYVFQAEFKQAETEARNNQRGLWNPDVCK